MPLDASTRHVKENLEYGISNRQSLPPLYSQQNVDDPLVICHFFLPDTDWDWYVVEFDGTEIFYGWSPLVQGMGTFHLSELRIMRGLQGMSVQRDGNFLPVPLSKVKELRPSIGAAQEAVA